MTTCRGEWLPASTQVRLGRSGKFIKAFRWCPVVVVGSPFLLIGSSFNPSYPPKRKATLGVVAGINSPKYGALSSSTGSFRISS